MSRTDRRADLCRNMSTSFISMNVSLQKTDQLIGLKGDSANFVLQGSIYVQSVTSLRLARALRVTNDELVCLECCHASIGQGIQRHGIRQTHFIRLTESASGMLRLTRCSSSFSASSAGTIRTRLEFE
jgi:hypothetical protein